MPQLKLEDFSAGYPGASRVISGVSMTLARGTVTAVIGPNGSGKSTLLKGIMGFPGVESSPGVYLDTVPVHTMGRKEKALKIGYLPQFPPVPQGLTGLEAVLLGRYPHRDPWSFDSAEDRKAALLALEKVDAVHLADKYVNRISGGEFRLVNLAGVLVQETPVILLDEPASSLDYGHASHIWRVLSQLAEGGRIIIATTHRIGMAAGYLNRVLLLSGGKPAGFGTAEEIFTGEDLLASVYKTPLKVVRNSAGKGWVVCPAGES